MSILNRRLPIGTDLGYSTLTANIDNSQTTIAVASASAFVELSASVNRQRFIPAIICPATDPTAVTFTDLQAGEHIVITDHVAASLTLNVQRGSTPLSHLSGALVMIMPTAQVWESIYQFSAMQESVLAASLGGGPGGGAFVMNYGATAGTSFNCIESGTPNMNANLQPGIGGYAERLMKTDAISVLAFTAPAVSEQEHLICAYPIDDSIVVVAGTEGGGTPATPANHIPLWRVVIPTTATSIKNSTDGTNGYLVDVRDLA